MSYIIQNGYTKITKIFYSIFLSRLWYKSFFNIHVVIAILNVPYRMSALNFSSHVGHSCLHHCSLRGLLASVVETWRTSFKRIFQNNLSTLHVLLYTDYKFNVKLPWITFWTWSNKNVFKLFCSYSTKII